MIWLRTELQHDLDKLGIAKNAREEKKRARDAKQQAAPVAALAQILRDSGWPGIVGR